MSLPKGSTKTAREFARAVVRRKWEEILPLLSQSLRDRTTAESLADEFGWKQLGPRLRRMYIEESGEPEDIVPHLDPPKRFEVFEVEERDAPANLDPSVPFGWVEVDFQPGEDSGFDVCYNCFLAFVDEGGPRVAAFEIESAME
ncbi:MAG: hypothetical protein U0835_15165 [Isosphaeraceae bacterium]